MNPTGGLVTSAEPLDFSEKPHPFLAHTKKATQRPPTSWGDPEEESRAHMGLPEGARPLTLRLGLLPPQHQPGLAP